VFFHSVFIEMEDIELLSVCGMLFCRVLSLSLGKQKMRGKTILSWKVRPEGWCSQNEADENTEQEEQRRQ